LFAGHTHENKITALGAGGIKTIETAANVNNPLARIVQVYSNGDINYSDMLGYGMVVQAHSPIDLEIIDPDGLVINKQTNQIAGAEYDEEDIDGDGDMEDSISILERKMGDYQIRIIAEPGVGPDEIYSLDISTLEDDFGYVPIILAQDVPVSEIPSEPYIFHSKEKQSTQIVYSGDLSGQYSNQINLMANLIDANGNPLVDEKISFAIGEQSVKAITNASGYASATLTIEQAAGKYYLAEVNFAGNEDYLPSFDSKQFEIVKKGMEVIVADEEGFSFDDLIIEAQIIDENGNILLGGPYEVEFKVGEEIIGIMTIGENGEAKIDWKVDLIPKELSEEYPILVTFTENEYYLSAHGEATFTLKSPQWLKNDAIMELQTNLNTNKLLVSSVVNQIQNSLDGKLWIDSSHLTFLENCQISESEIDSLNLEKDFNLTNRAGKKIKCLLQNSGLNVFLQEYSAVKLMDNFIIKSKFFDKIRPVFEEVIEKLVRADELLAQIAFNEAQYTQSSNPKTNKEIERLLTKAEKQFDKAEDELSKGKPGRVIIRLAVSWLYAQTAVKLIN
ncbi:MAG: Ig-like domain-containing protein, partial [Candidatus Falkowbacteria bacterium]